jgi:hypothetical protein
VAIFFKENTAAEGLWKKTLGGKLQHQDFPPSLGIQQKALDSHFSHSPDGCWMFRRRNGEK